DNIILGSLQRFVDRFCADRLDCCLAFARVKEPERFGVAVFNKRGELSGVIEKPAIPPSDLAVTGIYLYNMQAHLKAFEHISQADSHRNEYEISHIHDWLLKNGYKVGYEEITGWWKDTGKAEDLLEGNQLLLNEMTIEEATIDATAEVDKDARLQGRVKIGKGAVIGQGTLIRGPVVIGDRTHITGAFIGPHTSIGNDVIIEGAEIMHSIVMDEAVIKTRKRIMDSIIGKAAILNGEPVAVQGVHSMVIGQNSTLAL
ncbi:MAG: sugar phosphate nucleotidyltransferase, partial [Patescibacteria group bacterium]